MSVPDELRAAAERLEERAKWRAMFVSPFWRKRAQEDRAVAAWLRVTADEAAGYEAEGNTEGQTRRYFAAALVVARVVAGDQP